LKTSLDPRHLFRQKVVQALFERSFNDALFSKREVFTGKFISIIDDKKVQEETKDISQKESEIDCLIQEAAPEWPIDKITKVDLVILRLAVYELTVSKDAPVKVIVDEAVELAKEFGGEKSSQFVNGALGKVVKNINSVEPLNGEKVKQ